MLLRDLLALAIVAVVCATPNAAFGTKQYPTTIPALDTARKQHAQDILQCYEIPSHSIDAGTALDVTHIENAEREETVRRALRAHDPDLLSAEEVHKAGVRCLAVKSAHVNEFIGAQAPPWEQLLTTLKEVQEGQNTLEAGQLELKEGQKTLEAGQLKLKEGHQELKEGQTALHAKIVNSRATRATDRLVPVPSTGPPQAALGTPVPQCFPRTRLDFESLSQGACSYLEKFYGLHVKGGGDQLASVERRNPLAGCIGSAPV
mmetsp:Transcript_37482/g.88596  ORF Transcript_37482/g.88596 Transcript_37482/m.88596 type:complete len:261 (+) Transcript_37482:114-896(+)|eukprot:CAMPEP_0177713816 /NCGR_PEP_ID=MMETSP0484_2-20121128/13137_1 /TAXON_ID=354590 /ORGANISM="Rhodomonas lens, Strain RHODO" /LENGTH=260 /DNA_ID=CAMNT_0019225723 /DNA_START=109 /DNA_END=891 /DNA_ORIENTATION=+